MMGDGGEAAPHLRCARETRALPFDEVDALTGERTQGNDVGEIRRVLNSFLQFLEQDCSESLVVAASNHPQLLDRALIRRFESVIEYPLPSPAVIERVVRNRLAAVPTSDIDWAAVRDAGRGHSHAELTMDARDGSDGVAVLMRYTLRLLTAQQFQVRFS
jgi:SpoVK/Ycf46/Vps4 family AAA+-type ATPase